MSSDAGGHDAAWLERGREWAKQDPNPRTRDDILALVHDGDAAALQARRVPQAGAAPPCLARTAGRI